MEKTALVKVAKIVGTWIPAILLMLVFIPQGLAKFSDTSGWTAAFRHWGYPDWFRMLIGALELSAALLLFLGRTAAFGAIIIIVVMLGAWATHLILEGGRHMTSEVVPLVLATIVLIVRRRQVTGALARLRGGPERS
jgi:putative oxidoreductase